jgi:tetratricopeptide (TPR) repeat protein
MGKKPLLATVFLGLALAWTALASAAELAGRLIFIQGQVAVRPAGTAVWHKAHVHQDLMGGDMVRTGPNSRAAILSLDESQIKLNENTVMLLKSVAPSPRLRLGEIAPAVQAREPASVYGVMEGEIWLRNKKEEFFFELETPTVTATIRGTELNVLVLPDGTTSVVLLEGDVKLSNPYGEVVLAAGEEGLARPGQAPTKRVLVQPADAVQWSLFYPGYFSYRDLPLQALEGAGPAPGGPSALDALLSQGVAAYDRGRLEEAGAIAEQALAQAPADSRALTLAGWVQLQRRQPEEALGFFQRLPRPGAAAVVGTALARYQVGDVVGAYLLMKSADKPNPGHPLVTAMTGYFAMLVGEAEEARRLFTAAAAGPEPVARLLATCYLAQMDIVQNRKEQAQSQADRALAQAPSSPLALLTRALVDIAYFQLPAARERLEQALEADPGFVDAALYLARVYLGGDYLTKARRTVDQALQQAPRDASVLSLAGFVSLTFRQYEKAQELFTKAVRESPRLGEPHLGLAFVHFRHRRMDQALAAMLTATLLDPRISVYQSELGKAFYQVRAFDKALATWNYAATLDPRDPMPHFYRGVALTDLNRPGEAIQSINRSIALNDNRAVFRSRLLLDRDRAVRNYNLARAYNQLDLGEWARSKALTAVKLDPLDGTPHLFLARSLLATGQVPATDAESLLYRVLSPATQTTFRFLLENDYTSMFEMPYARATVQGGIGAWEERKTIQDHSVAAYGGIPGAAFYGQGNYVNDRGFRERNGSMETWNAEGLFKGEPTVFGNLTGFAQYNNQNFANPGPLNDYFFDNEGNLTRNLRFRIFEVSYLHRFSPKCSLLAFFSHHGTDDHVFANSATLFDPDLDMWLNTNFKDLFDADFHNVQVQQRVVLGKHTLIAGFDYFYGIGRFETKFTQQLVIRDPLIAELFGVSVIPIDPFNPQVLPPEKNYSFYLLDYWRPAPWLLVELGVFRDVAKNMRAPNIFLTAPESIDRQPIGTTLWSPRLGLNIQINPQHVLRFALLRHLNTHLNIQPLLVPAEVAGLTWPVESRRGSEVRQAGASWEAQWDPKTFTVLRFDATRVGTPDYLLSVGGPLPFMHNAWTSWRRYQASLFLNRILTNSLGLTLGVTGKRVLPDATYRDPINFPLTGLHRPLEPFTEVSGLLGLAFLTPQGWQGGIRTRLVYQFLKGRDADNLFGLVSLRFGKELAHKRGLITFEVQNLFNRHFDYLLEPRRTFIPEEFFPARRFVGKVALYF